ncbi:MAG: DUF3084 domain-containing protein [Candidatus Eremiobacteraeota bacterium]|nr:DUF3084 domain-containing protein [Candidatus Eremiobacteraeota bacterium]
MKVSEILKLAAIIVCMGILGGAIAFLGNQLGRFIGRKKLSVLKLRPRYTSMLITVITGMVIASVTLTFAVVVSENARRGLLEYQQLKTKIAEQKELLDKLRSDIDQAIIVYKNNEIILSAKINPEPSKMKMKEKLKGIVAQTNQLAIRKSKDLAKKTDRTFKLPKNKKLVGFIPDNLDEVAGILRRASKQQIIFVRANQNAILSRYFTIQLSNPISNRLIFKKGEFITSARIDGTKAKDVITEELYNVFINRISRIAMSRDLIPDPGSGSVGEIDSKYLFDVVNEIKKKNKKVYVDFFTREDTYTLGPLKLNIKVRKMPDGE